MSPAPVLSSLNSNRARSAATESGQRCKHFSIFLGAAIIVLAIMASQSVEAGPAFVVLCVCVMTLGYAASMSVALLEQDTGTPKMRRVAGFIQAGAQGFFRTQFTAIAIMALVTGGLVFVGFLFRPTSPDVSVSPFVLSVITTASFAVGALCSCAAGFAGLWISVRTNVRVASAARRSYLEAIQTSMRGGMVASLVVVSLAVLGVLVLFLVMEEMFVGVSEVAAHANEVPLLLVGYGFGASFVALFAQLGGGIYTKAADVGADLVGKVEAGIPEDDPRNPAVIADLVGDNVGDCAGRGADLFESIAAEIISAMILGGTMSTEARVPGTGFVMFPLVVHAFDCIISSVGWWTVASRSARNAGDGKEQLGSPLQILNRGFYTAGALSLCSFGVACRWLLWVETAPGAWWQFYLCGLYGMAACYASVAVSTYYTSTEYTPVRDIAKASQSGHATNVIMGISVGMESTGLPILIMSAAILGAYWTGDASGLRDSRNVPTGGLFGTAVATMGMLSTAVYVLGMDFFGPIADNAGGIVEMSDEPERVREITDELDAVGNTTKAATKGYAVGSAALACFLLYSAFRDEVSSIAGGKEVGAVDLSRPEVFVSGLLAAMTVFMFCSWTIRAVGDVAITVVDEVRAQFQARPGILSGSEDPDYERCVAIVAKASLRKMVKPGLLAIFAPTAVGLFFRAVGNTGLTPDPMAGARAVCSFLMFATVTGVVMGLFLNNTGGAWDNAKKLVETGMHGGKGSLAHKASITGDTVGDPFKDAAGPSLHVLIKLLATVTLVLAPLFVSHSGDAVVVQE
jgi:H(+)-translocating pyrophosphatase